VCCNARAKAFREANPDHIKQQKKTWAADHRVAIRAYSFQTRDRAWECYILRFYGLTPSDFDRLLVSQNGVCAVCRQAEHAVDPRTGMTKRLAVDHDHSMEYAAGKCRKEAVRGLLCTKCNTAAGMLGDSVERAFELAAYFEKFYGGKNVSSTVDSGVSQQNQHRAYDVGSKPEDRHKSSKGNKAGE
jgi:hypothetical protein